MLSPREIERGLLDGTFVYCNRCNRKGCARCNGNGFTGNCNIELSEYEPRIPQACKPKGREGNHRPQKTTVEDRWLIRLDHENGMTQAELVEKYQLSQSTISDIINMKFKRSK